MTGFNVADARALRARLRQGPTAEAVREAFEERAAIIEEGCKVPRETAERWARECIRRVPGAV